MLYSSPFWVYVVARPASILFWSSQNDSSLHPQTTCRRGTEGYAYIYRVFSVTDSRSRQDAPHTPLTVHSTRQATHQATVPLARRLHSISGVLVITPLDYCSRHALPRC